ncbi:ROK family protein [Streptomyces sp. NPDC058335]|uniref:ROK family protein n=1 Tax=Streptomyces sp. NPDC058335 TaxID=3346451 RepID=UPI00366762FF
MIGSTARLGIDVGGTKVALRARAAGQELHEETLRWPGPDAEHDLAALDRCVTTLLARLDTPVDAVGVAMPATLDPAGRILAWPGRPSWQGVDVHGVLRALFPTAVVRCADDGDLAALAEAEAARCADVVYVGVGTGVGGGVVLDGRLCPGPDKGSCEIGHLVVDSRGPRCDCGRRGCVQALASGPATLRRATELSGSEVDFAALRQGWSARTPWAVTAVDDGCAALAAALIGLNEIFRPSLTLIGGGFAKALPGYAELVGEHVRSLARPGHPPAPVGPAALGGLSSLDGALLLAERSLPRATVGRGA